MSMNAQTRVNRVIGFPLQHTYSPVLHQAVYRMLNINAVLLAFPHQDLPLVVQSIRALAVELTAVTMPFKEAVLAHLDVRSPEVDKIQAANTMIQRAGKLYGSNTDVDGIDYALRKTKLAAQNVLLIGAGGAARAAAYVLQKHHANIFWLNRTPSTAQIAAKRLGGEVIDHTQLPQLPVHVIINATPLGMSAHSPLSPLPNYPFNPSHTVLDMVYNPVNTPLLIQAKQQRAKIISGLDMFIGQGLRQIELWQGAKIGGRERLAEIRRLLLKQ